MSAPPMTFAPARLKGTFSFADLVRCRELLEGPPPPRFPVGGVLNLRQSLVERMTVRERAAIGQVCELRGRPDELFPEGVAGAIVSPAASPLDPLSSKVTLLRFPAAVEPLAAEVAELEGRSGAL